MLTPVYEYIPNVIEPSFGIGRILYSMIEHCYWPRPEDADRGVGPEPKEINRRFSLSRLSLLRPNVFSYRSPTILALGPLFESYVLVLPFLAKLQP